ncbi:5743_t:CDS:2 [Racocetra fulgida]|uniref:5743_t:CDS:1 n=1 Tax=Racocetra fulgida TaxID=60492 RepID=A0A9N9F1K1_9GLOM|nr:5743_t:CDS:2 [Racocetra fulgida]
MSTPTTQEPEAPNFEIASNLLQPNISQRYSISFSPINTKLLTDKNSSMT